MQRIIVPHSTQSVPGSREDRAAAAHRVAERILHFGEGLDAEVRQLAHQYGDIVYEEVVDALTEDTAGTFPQRKQDRLTASSLPVEIDYDLSGRQTLNVISLESLPDGTIMDIVSDMVPVDFYQIAREAHLTRIESYAFDWWLAGHNSLEIAPWILHRDGRPYTDRGIRAILQRARDKVAGCPTLGWRTCLAEDIRRGKHRRPPLRVSWVEVIRQAAHH